MMRQFVNRNWAGKCPRVPTTSWNFNPATTTQLCYVTSDLTMMLPSKKTSVTFYRPGNVFVWSEEGGCGGGTSGCLKCRSKCCRSAATSGHNQQKCEILSLWAPSFSYSFFFRRKEGSRHHHHLLILISFLAFFCPSIQVQEEKKKKGKRQNTRIMNANRFQVSKLRKRLSRVQE